MLIVIGALTVVPSYSQESKVFGSWENLCNFKLNDSRLTIDDFLCELDILGMYDRISILNDTMILIDEEMTRMDYNVMEYNSTITNLNNMVMSFNDIMTTNSEEIIRLNAIIDEQKTKIEYFDESTRIYILQNLRSLVPNDIILDNIEIGDGMAIITLKEYVQKVDTNEATHLIVKLNDVIFEDNMDLNTRTITFNNLEDNMVHSVRINAINIFGASFSSVILLDLTDPPHTEAPPHIADPPVITVSSILRTGLNIDVVEHDDGNSTIIDYFVEISTDDGVNWEEHDNNFNISYILMRGLINGQEYNIRVSTVNEIGTSEPSNILISTPARSPITENFTVSEIGSDYIILTWDIVDDGGSELLGHRIEYKLLDVRGLTIIDHDTTTTIRINNLIPNTGYQFFLYPYNIAAEPYDEDTPVKFVV